MNSQQFDTNEWAQIFFNGKPLPPAFKAISILSSFADIPEVVEDWIMNLHYCAGRIRTADAVKCHQYAELILNYLIENRALVKAEIDERLGEYGFVGTITYSDWIKGFSAIRDLAQNAETECQWIAPISADRLKEFKKNVQRFKRFLDRVDDEIDQT